MTTFRLNPNINNTNWILIHFYLLSCSNLLISLFNFSSLTLLFSFYPFLLFVLSSFPLSPARTSKDNVNVICCLFWFRCRRWCPPCCLGMPVTVALPPCLLKTPAQTCQIKPNKALLLHSWLCIGSGLGTGWTDRGRLKQLTLTGLQPDSRQLSTVLFFTFILCLLCLFFLSFYFHVLEIKDRDHLRGFSNF